MAFIHYITSLKRQKKVFFVTSYLDSVQFYVLVQQCSVKKIPFDSPPCSLSKKRNEIRQVLKIVALIIQACPTLWSMRLCCWVVGDASNTWSLCKNHLVTEKSIETRETTLASLASYRYIVYGTGSLCTCGIVIPLVISLTWDFRLVKLDHSDPGYQQKHMNERWDQVLGHQNTDQQCDNNVLRCPAYWFYLSHSD